MSELEHQLSQADLELAKQYKQDLKRLSEPNEQLQQQVNNLNAQVSSFNFQRITLKKQIENEREL